VFAVTAEFPTGGDYTAHIEFRQQGQMTAVLAAIPLQVAGTAPAPVGVPAADVRTQVEAGVRVDLNGDAVLVDESDLHFEFSDATTGEPVTELQPYLGAAGHVAVISADGARFSHRHAETLDDQGRPVLAVPGTQFGPDLGLHVRFEEPGAYRLFAQFRLANERVITLPFVVHTDAPHRENPEDSH
jgi:Cu+-exporting ATPase